MNYTPYPKSKDTPNRKNRKSARHTIFRKNYMLKKVQKKAKVEADE